MAHLLNIFKAFLVKRKQNRYIRAKNVALQLSEEEKPFVSLPDRLHYWWWKYCCCGCLRVFFRANLGNSSILKLFMIYNQITTPGTFSNYVTIAVLGFIGGVILTYFYFAFCSVILNLSLPSTFWISVMLCFFFTIGLAFSKRTRCVTLSVLPELFTRKARNLFISYAFVLLITGPGANIFYNSRQLTETISCTREQLNSVSRNLTELYLKPLRSLRRVMIDLINKIRPIVEKIRTVIVFIKDAIVSIGRIIKNTYEWLLGSNSLCNKKIGTPYERCVRMSEQSLLDCRAKVYFIFRSVCDLSYIVKVLCNVLKPLNLFCTLTSFVREDIFLVIQEKVHDLNRLIKTMFYVSISFHHSFAFETNQTRSVKDVLKDVFHAQQNRLNLFFSILNLMSFIFGMCLLLLFISIFIYRRRFFYHMHYDNYHLNKYIIELDARRAAIKRQTIFPLTNGEKMYYVSLFSLRLTIRERINLLKDSHFILFSCIKMLYLFLIDVALYWVLDTINKRGRVHFYFGSDKTIVETKGSGFWFSLYTFINHMLKPLDLEFRFDTHACLPEAISPNYFIYERVVYIMFFAWFTVLFQPFGLRFRNRIMCNYYPEAARRRAVWLYNYILQSRGNINLFIRRQLLRKNAFGLRSERPTLRRWLLTRFPRLGFIIPYKMEKECSLCGYTQPTVKCATPECPGIYCGDCFKSLNETCLSCNMPQHLESTNISEEEDSEEDDDEIETNDVDRPWWKFWIRTSTAEGYNQISLVNVEKAEPYRYSENNFKSENSAFRRNKGNVHKDYFGESFRKLHWAFMDDFLIPLPESNSWARSKFQIVENHQHPHNQR